MGSTDTASSVKKPASLRAEKDSMVVAAVATAMKLRTVNPSAAGLTALYRTVAPHDAEKLLGVMPSADRVKLTR